MARINRIATGLQSLLGTKSLGRDPQEVLEAVRPVVDISNHYYANAQIKKDQGTYTGAIAAGVVAQLTIPNGEAWSVIGVTTQFLQSGGVTTYASYSPCIELPSDTPGEEPMSLATDYAGPFGSNTIADTVNVASQLQGRIFPPGTIFATRVGILSSGGIVGIIRTQVLYTSLQV